MSSRFEIGEHLLARRALSDILHYFKSQRTSGRYDRADRAVPFTGSRKGTVDVHGGWYDASGDLSKYLTHLSYANTMNPQQTPIVVWCLLEGLERLRGADGRLAAVLEQRILEEALHGADFLVRMQDPEGYFYTTVFDRWSHDPGRAADLLLFHAAGDTVRPVPGRLPAGRRRRCRRAGDEWRAAARSGDYSPDRYLAAAESGFRHLQLHSIEYLPDARENIIDDYCALLAACELLCATGHIEYGEAAEARAASLVARLSRDERFSGWWRADEQGEQPFFHAVEAGLPVLALIRFLQAIPESRHVADAGEADPGVTRLRDRGDR